jgi:hypothetical protein
MDFRIVVMSPEYSNILPIVIVSQIDNAVVPTIFVRKGHEIQDSACFTRLFFEIGLNEKMEDVGFTDKHCLCSPVRSVDNG